jgi:hypothetical protein
MARLLYRSTGRGDNWSAGGRGLRLGHGRVAPLESTALQALFPEGHGRVAPLKSAALLALFPESNGRVAPL